VIFNHPLLATLNQLIAIACVAEEDDVITLSGTANSATALANALPMCESAGLPVSLQGDGVAISVDELAGVKRWSLTLDKAAMVPALGLIPSDGETIRLFFTEGAFEHWSSYRTILHGAPEPWPARLTIMVAALDVRVSGPSLRAGPISAVQNFFDTASLEHFPDPLTVARTVYMPPAIAVRTLRQSALTRGDIDHPAFAILRTWAAQDAATLLADEISVRDPVAVAILRGGRRAELPLRAHEPPISAADLAFRQDTIRWIFDEHVDSRHALVADRLRLEWRLDDTMESLVQRELPLAMPEARERYREVVLEKKDLAAKELRDVLKEVRTQADLYAAKVRDLIAGFLRDFLASLLLIGVGVLARIDGGKLHELAEFAPANIFFRTLSIYFVISAMAQIFIQKRDLQLTGNELTAWLSAAREYLPSARLESELKEHIEPRRKFFMIALIVIGVLNGVTAVALWNWQSILQLAL
jgi:hypothetical protein